MIQHVTANRHAKRCMSIEFVLCLFRYIISEETLTRDLGDYSYADIDRVARLVYYYMFPLLSNHYLGNSP